MEGRTGAVPRFSAVGNMGDRMTLVARLLAVVVAVGTAVPAGAAVAADTLPVGLPVSTFADVVADPAHGQLFVSPGRSGSAVVVTDLSGAVTATIDTLPGATGMALSPDGASLWVALAKGDALARIDTASRTVVQRVSLPSATCPGDVAVVGTRVVYGYSCYTYGGSGATGGIGVVDAATGSVLGSDSSGAWYQPLLAAGPAGRVFAGDAGLSPTTLYLYDVTGAAPVLVHERWDTGSNLRDLASAPDGGLVVQASGWPYQHDVYAADGLASAGVYASGHYPNAAAWSADGRIVAVGTDSSYDPDVRLYAAGGATPLRTVELGAGVTLLPRGLAIAPDGATVWAVTRGSDDVIAVRQLGLTAPSASTLSLAADPPAGYPGSTVKLGGRLLSGGAAVPGATLAVTRTVAGVASTLPPVTTLGDGTYSFPTTLPSASGDATYRVEYAGDADRAPVERSLTVPVWSTAPTLSLRLSQPVTGSPSVSGSVTLRYAGTDSVNGVTVHVRRTSGGSSVTLPDVVTTPNGAASFTDQAPTGSVTYTVSVDPRGVHEAASTSATTSVGAAATSLSATPSATAVTFGSPVTVSGYLFSGGGVVSGRVVTVTRDGCPPGTAPVPVGSATTDATGRYSVVDAGPLPGTCTYRAAFAGDQSYAAASATSTTVSVARLATSLTVTAARGAGKDKKTVTVTARLGTTHLNRTVSISVSSGTGTVVLKTGTVDANGNLTVTHQPRTTATYTASFSGDDWYLPATASASV